MEIKALVSDSNSQVRRNIARSLKELGVKDIAEADDASQAIEMCERGKFDIVFAEWNSRTAKGEELIGTLRNSNAGLPIIATVPQSKQLKDVKKSCPNASNYLVTPFTTDQFRKSVQECVPSLAG